MDARELFFTIGSVALVILSAFVIFFFYALYRINKMARTGLALLRTATHDVRGSLDTIARGWGKATIASLVFRLLRTFIFKR